MRRANQALAKAWVKRWLQTRLARAGYLVSRLDDESVRYLEPSYNGGVPLPPGAEKTLHADNRRLAELRKTYDSLSCPAAARTQWNDSFLKKNLSMAWFRGDNAYVWQLRLMRGSADATTYLTLLDVQARDRLNLLTTLEEDGLFGAWTFRFGDRPAVSRDLLDSVNEINYLDDQIGLSSMPAPAVLDIGAGYGRLAHRMSAALPHLARYDCTDGVAVSTFLCEYYLTYRQVPDSVRVVPLPDVDTLADAYTLVVNVHSFSECSLDAIRWWMDRISERDIEWLLIVPNTPGALLSTESDGSRLDFQPDVERAGYELADHRPVYQTDELRKLIPLDDEFYLFRRSIRGGSRSSASA